MDDKNKQLQPLSDDELWKKAGNGQTISRSDLGIDDKNIKDGLQSLNEGLDIMTFYKH